MRKFIPKFIFSIYHYLLSLIGAIIYNFPSKKLIVIGVTGTNGKTTVVHLITEILEEALRPAQGKVASLSSIRFKIRKKEWPNKLKMTMPGRFKLQRFLRRTVKAGCKYAVLEITSEGIKQHRHRFIDFDGVVFTNLTKEHIEAHKGFENYKKAKGKLFKAVQKSKKKDKFAVINIDDRNSDYFLELSKGLRIYTYGIKNKEAEINPKKIKLKILLPGKFNIYNSLAAFAGGLALGIRKDKILNVLRTIKGLPGRMELVIEKPFKVFVDYAHTPDALESVYKTLGKGLICVFGSCGGDRDKWKRPEIGKIAERYCDKTILTNEDPYNENPLSIINEIKSGFSQIRNPKSEIRKIIDRRKAINKALSLAKKDDIVIITGKGSEPWIMEKNKKVSWDDRRVVREEYRKVTHRS